MRGQRYIGGTIFLLLCLLTGCHSASTSTSTPASTTVARPAPTPLISPAPTLTQAVAALPTYASATASRIGTAAPSATSVATHAGVSPVASPSYTGFLPPYAPPTSCPVSPWGAFALRRGFPAFWLDGDGMAAGVPVGAVLYEGEQKVQWQAEPGGGRTLQVTGARLDGPAPAARAENPVLIDVGTWASSTAFPAPGCWQLRGTAGVHTLAVTVYVYPAACRPSAIGGRPSTPAPCTPPGP
jgi:hypothetical protein